MADRQNHTSGHSLPPCSELFQQLQGFKKCRVPECNAFFPNEGSRALHEQSCDVARERTQHLSSLAYRPAQQYPVQPHRLDTQMASNAVDTDSDDSIVFTPGTSRAPSLCDPHERRQSGVIRTAARRYRSSSSTPETERRNPTEPKKLKKQENEKRNRGMLGSVLFRIEDSFRNYLGWERREQSGGNGNGAGLQANKNTIMRGTEDLLNFFIHREYCQGMADGTLHERQAMMCKILDEASTRPAYQNTFLDPGDQPVCTHADSKSKECIVHGHADWRECRLAHTGRRFLALRSQYVEEMGWARRSEQGLARLRQQEARQASSSSTQRRAR